MDNKGTLLYILFVYGSLLTANITQSAYLSSLLGAYAAP